MDLSKALCVQKSAGYLAAGFEDGLLRYQILKEDVVTLSLTQTGGSRVFNNLQVVKISNSIIKVLWSPTYRYIACILDDGRLCLVDAVTEQMDVANDPRDFHAVDCAFDFRESGNQTTQLILFGKKGGSASYSTINFWMCSIWGDEVVGSVEYEKKHGIVHLPRGW